MLKNILYLLLAFSIPIEAIAQATFGAGPVPAYSAPATTTMDLNTNGIRIVRPASVSDGYDGGVNITRDMSAASGGIPGNVNAANFTHTIVGKNVAAFEWALLSILDNSAGAGENTAGYFQANKFGTGETWALVTEVTDSTGGPGAMVSHEADVWTSGPDNGFRIGLDVLVGDARKIRNLPGYGVAQGTYGVRIGASGGTPWATWSVAQIMDNFTGTGLVIRGNAERGIWLQGKEIVGIDLSGATLQTAIRMKPGQRITFDDYDQYGVSQDRTTHDIVFDVGGHSLMRLTPSGDLYVHGTLHQNQ